MTSKRTVKIDIKSPDYYTNRELSWLQFNERVLQEADDETNKLAERIKFLMICENNLDEFFMVRVAGLKQKVANEIEDVNRDNLTPTQQLQLINQKLRAFYSNLYDILNKKVLPSLTEFAIDFVNVSELRRSDLNFLRDYFLNELYPILTPLAVDLGHPFPRLANRSLNLAITINKPKTSKQPPLFAVVQVPSSIDNLVALPANRAYPGRSRYVWLQDIITHFITELFPGFKIDEVHPFRITRDSDLIIEEDEVDDLIATIQRELFKREKGAPVRIEIKKGASEKTVDLLKSALYLEETDIYIHDGIFPLFGFKKVLKDSKLAKEIYKPFTALSPVLYDSPENIYKQIDKHDIFLHHPFDSFTMVEDFVNAASNDPKVLAIKQTLYRTGSPSRIIGSLINAARNGKQVTALVELKARFDEQTNIEWAKKLEEEGIHVVYGLIGFKTHCKVCMVVRKEDKQINRYVHLSTGNYNSQTARLYTDMGIFTKDKKIADDITHLFNSITGYAKLPRMNRIFNSPDTLKEEVINRITIEINNAKQGKKAEIKAKMNSLVDVRVIEKLYEASIAGVKIKLLIRGICCLKPGLAKISENIEVSSIVGRLLEHSRIFTFENDGEICIYLSSADWMPRNFHRRIETMIPILDEKIKTIVLNTLELYFSDNVKRRILTNDGKYIIPKVKTTDELINAQERLIELRRAELETREKQEKRKKTLKENKNSPKVNYSRGK